MTNTTGAIERIVIVGGGTAGWMTAAALARALDPLGTAITLIESDEIGTVGVGEATIPGIHAFNAMLGIDQADFLRFCHGTFKLGIEFVDWGALGDHYIHPFARYGRDKSNLPFHQLWLRYAAAQTAAGKPCSIEDYNICCAAARDRRFTHPISGETSDIGPLNYAFHFDASLYAKYLASLCAARGQVQRIEGKIVDVAQHAGTGLIESVTLDHGETITGDLFIDCSGFRGLLIEQALNTGYDDWITYLPCNRALAVPSRSVEPPIPYTRATADAAGWRWRIPLQHRIGNGYVYSSAHISDADAAARLLSQLDGEPMAEPRPIRFVTGRRRQFWNRNVVAIGLAAGFLEPLESTSIHLIQTAILRLLAFFPDKSFDPAEIATFNRQTAAEYERTRDFIILHYKATERDDTPFWRHCRDMAVPDAVAEAIELFRSRGRIMVSLDHLFTPPSWLAVMIGQRMMPRGYDPLADGLSDSALAAEMAEVKWRIATQVQAMPRHHEYIAAFCGVR